jgi:hypothetical protein
VPPRRPASSTPNLRASLEPDPSSIESFGLIAGAIVSAAGVGTLLWGALRLLRTRLTRSWLRGQLSDLGACNREMVDAIRVANQALIDGVGWEGWAIPPRPLGPALAQLDRVEVELVAIGAALGGRDAEGALGRLRDDLEQVAHLMVEQLNAHTAAIWSAYRAAEGEEIGTSATGREVIPVVGGGCDFETEVELVANVERRRRLVSHLVRASYHQLGDGLRAHGFTPQWPIWTYELEQYMDPPRMLYAVSSPEDTKEASDA